MFRLRILVAAGLVGALAIVACKREPEPTPPRYPAGGAGPYSPPSYPPPITPPPPAPTPTPPPASPPAPTQSGPPPAAGLPCTYDTDLVCPFGRCIQGRCGGCRGDADCKPGGACLNTPVGLACMPGTGSMPSPPPPATTPPAPAPAPTPTPTPAPPTQSWTAARDRCVQKTNELRATKGLAGVSRRSDREACIDGQAQGDAAATSPHANFGKCGELAQNECPGWKGTPDSIVDSCLKAMFDEGPGAGSAHGHYNNIMEPGYHGVGCGFWVGSDGTVWLTQDFFK